MVDIGMMVFRFVTNLFDGLFIMLIALAFFGIKLEKKQLIAPIFTMTIINTLLGIVIVHGNELFSNFAVIAKTSASLLIIFFIIACVSYFLKKGFIMSFIPVAIYLFTSAFNEVFYSVLFGILKLDFLEAYRLVWPVLIAKITGYTLNILVIYQIEKIRRLTIKISISVKYLALYLFATIVILIINFNTVYYYYENHLDIWRTALITLTFVGYFGVSILIGRNFIKLQLKENDVEHQKFYNASMQGLIDELRSYKHGGDNVLATIRGYVKRGDLQGLDKYLSEIDAKNSEINYIDNYIYQSILNPGLAGLLQTKLAQMRSVGIDVKLVIEGTIEKVNCKISDFCEVLGIMLDNAAEAALESKDKFVKISIFENNDTISVELNNSTATIPDIVKVFENGYSTKGEGRGMGLWILKRIVGKYNHIIYNIFTEENVVSQELVV